MFTYTASPSKKGNATIRRVCNNMKCEGVFFVTANANGYRCPHCNWRQ